MSKKKYLNETKNHNPPPCKLNGRSLTCVSYGTNNKNVTTSYKNIVINSMDISCETGNIWLEKDYTTTKGHPSYQARFQIHLDCKIKINCPPQESLPP